MSSMSFCRHTTTCIENDKKTILLANLVDHVNSNNLSIFYPRGESLFKKRIDKLNLKFYLETEKYLANEDDKNKCQDLLFLILFKQISLYIEEIERLNLQMKDKRCDKTNEKINGQDKTENIINNSLKNYCATLEKKLADQAHSEEKMKQENEILKRQNQFYKEKLHYDLIYKNLLGETWSSSKKSERSSDDFSTNASTAQNEIVTSNPSSNKNSLSKKISITLFPNAMNNEQQEKKNEMMTSENSPAKRPPNGNDDQNMNNTMINKKRNYSDNNPKNNQINNIYFEMSPNISSNNCGNSRYNILGGSVENRKIPKETVSKSKFAVNNGSKNVVYKNLKIIKPRKESLGVDKECNSNSNSNLASSRSASANELKDSYYCAYMSLNTEISELNELERLLKNMKSQINASSANNSLSKASDELITPTDLNGKAIPNTDAEKKERKIGVASINIGKAKKKKEK